MKIRLLAIFEGLIIAFAALAAPVTADVVSVNGAVQSASTFSVVNKTLAFGTFTVGTNTISSTHNDTAGKFSVISLATNDPVWHIQVSGTDGGKMKSTSAPTLLLTNQMKIRNNTVVTGVTGPASAQTITGSSTNLLNGAPLATTFIPLELSQTVLATDAAKSDYAMTVTLTYVPS